MTEEQFIEFSKLNPKAAENYLATLASPGYELIPDWSLQEGQQQVIQQPSFVTTGKIKMNPLQMAQFVCYISNYDDKSFEMAKKILHEFIDRKFMHVKAIDTYIQTGVLICQD